MNIKTPALILVCLLFCCYASVKWQRNYNNRHILKLQKKYSLKNEYEFTISNSLFINKPANQFSRKEVKNNVAGMGRIFALIPDSIYESNKGIDTFYTNRNKIAFI